MLVQINPIPTASLCGPVVWKRTTARRGMDCSRRQQAAGALRVSASGPGRVKTRLSQGRSELFSQLPFASSTYQCVWFPQLRNRDENSTRKFSVRVFTQPRSKAEKLNGSICFALCPQQRMRWMAPAHGIWVPRCEGHQAFTSKMGAIRHADYHDRPRLSQERFSGARC
jgi:hypothetical protein